MMHNVFLLLFHHSYSYSYSITSSGCGHIRTPFHCTFAVTSTDTLQVFSLATATKLCHLSIHSEECCRIAVYAVESQNTRNFGLNRNCYYFIFSFSLPKRLIIVFLFNDREIPLKSIFKCLQAGKKKAEQDFHSLSLTRLTVLFVPCNSAIQKNAFFSVVDSPM